MNVSTVTDKKQLMAALKSLDLRTNQTIRFERPSGAVTEYKFLWSEPAFLDHWRDTNKRKHQLNWPQSDKYREKYIGNITRQLTRTPADIFK